MLKAVDRYKERGVSSDKKGVGKAVKVFSKGILPGAFCNIFPDPYDPRRVQVLHADGVGTKVNVLYLMWREGLATQADFDGIAQDCLVMNIDDMAAVGAFGPYLFVNGLSRNSKCISDDFLKKLMQGFQNVTEHLSRFGIKITIAGGETADVPNLVRTFDVMGSMYASLDRSQVIDASRMRPGDMIVGFSSTGQATWETQPNSGIGSNGLTSAQHDLLSVYYKRKYTETFAPEIDRDLLYCGHYCLEDVLPTDEQFTVGQALLSPTRTYAPMMRMLAKMIPIRSIHGIIHCSGGGQTKIGKFGRSGAANGLEFVKDSMFAVPPLFALIQEQSGACWEAMYQTFNMGSRMEVVVPKRWVQACLDCAEECDIEARLVGYVDKNSRRGNRVLLHTEYGKFVYNF